MNEEGWNEEYVRGLEGRVEGLRNALLYITASEGRLGAHEAADFWRAASAALIRDNKAARDAHDATK